MKNILKRLLLFSIILSSFQFIQAQKEWAPIGAEWYYNQPGYYSMEGNGSKFLLFQAIKDTMINGTESKVISISENGMQTVAYEYLSQEGDSIFYYNTHSNTFNLLYNFSAVAGDTVVIHNEEFTPTIGFYSNNDKIAFFKYKILEVDSTQISDEWLVRQKVVALNDGDWGFFNGTATVNSQYIIETIGSLAYFFGKSGNIIPEEQPSLLRCYNNQTFSYVNPDWGKACDYYTNINVSENESIISLYPNPVKNILQIKAEDNIILKIEIFDLKGSETYYFEPKSQSHIINTEYWLEGIYSVKIQTRNNSFVDMLIKN